MKFPDEARLERPPGVGLVSVPAALALTAMLLAACGGRDDGAKIEASLRHYIGTLAPESSMFPAGAGLPRVRRNSCADRHVKTKRGEVLQLGGSGIVRIPEGFVWSCVVTFGKSLTLPALAIVNGRTEVVGAMPLPFEAFVFQHRCPPYEPAKGACSAFRPSPPGPHLRTLRNQP